MARKKDNYLLTIAERAELKPQEFAALLGITPGYITKGIYLDNNSCKYWLAGQFMLGILEDGFRGPNFQIEFLNRSAKAKAGLIEV